MSMTVQEFDAGGKDTQPCRQCGHLGMARSHNANNNGWRVVCPDCQSIHPWGAHPYLAHTTKKHRKDDSSRDGCSMVEVWARTKNRCSFCTLPMHALADIRIGLSRHHVTERYDPSETDCAIIPVCNACKAIVDARQREAWRWYHRLLEITGEPLSDRRAGLSPPGVLPDPVRPPRKAPDGGLEGFSDDDAD